MNNGHYILYDYQSTQKPFLHDWDKLDAYIQEMWINRLKLFDESFAAMENESQQKILSIDKNHNLRANKYVGVIYHEGIKVEIRSRIFLALEGNKHWINLLFWLSYCSRINFPFNKMNTGLDESEDLLEILISIFARHTIGIVSALPYVAFEDICEESSVLKGELQIEQYIHKNISTGNWHKFQVKYKPLTSNNRLNKIIKYVCRMLMQLSTNSLVELSNIIGVLDDLDVDDVVCESNDCSMLILNPIFDGYKPILSMCEMFLEHLTINPSSHGIASFSFLLPMDYVFENFIFGFIDKHLPHYQPTYQKESWLAKQNGCKVFKMKSDIILMNPSLIIDTKYKMRMNNEDGKGGVIHGDMYQMIAYALRCGIKDVLLLYPHHSCLNAQNDLFTFVVEAGLQGVNDHIVINAASIDIRIETFNNESIERIVNSMVCIFDQILKPNS